MATSADFNSLSLILYSTGLVDDMSLYPGLWLCTSHLVYVSLHSAQNSAVLTVRQI